MKKLLALPILLFCTLSFAKTSALNIIPYPQSVKVLPGSFKAKGAGVNCDPALGQKGVKAVEEFADRLYLVTGKASSFATPSALKESTENGKIKGFVFLPDKSLKAEGYSIKINHSCVQVHVADYNGLLYSIQTLKQMLPEAIYGTVLKDGESWVLPCCEISDAPRFSYRGVHLDCARHFFSVDEVKKYLDVLALCKCNRFHWHLTEDQGWRVEIKKYPRLTEIGAYRDGTQIGYDRDSNDGIRYGGYYTQEQIRDIVAYADKLGITVIPEIDLPGHMLAAIASYPELGCEGCGPFKVWSRWGISKQVLCVGKESVMQFLEDVVSEMCEMFPGEYFHIGGDECPKDEWKTDPICQAKIRELGLKSDENASAEQRLQNYVTARMQKFLATKGKKIIGWDEILEGELAKGATVMSWRGSKGGIKAAGMGYDVIMTPNTYCYFDYAQSADLDKEPLGITKDPKRAVTVKKIYDWDPYESIPSDKQQHILGAQCNLWTEYIATPEHLEYMLLPRLFALCEVQWCAPSAKNYERFSAALSDHAVKILDILGYNYRKLQ